MFALLFFIGFVLSLAIFWLWCGVSFGIAKSLKKPETARQIGRIWKWSSVVATLTGAFVWWVFFPPAWVVYRAAFGEIPTSDAQLQSHSDGSFDGESTFLRFQAAPATIRRLASLKHLSLSTSVQDFHALGSTPAWWKPNPAISSVYALEQHPKNYSYRGTFLIYEPQNQTAYYAFSSVN